MGSYSTYSLLCFLVQELFERDGTLGHCSYKASSVLEEECESKKQGCEQVNYFLQDKLWCQPIIIRCDQSSVLAWESPTFGLAY